MFILLYLIIAFGCVWSMETAPVLIWGKYEAHSLEETAIPALEKLGALQFSQMLHSLISRRPHILLFAEDNLSIEDLSWRGSRETQLFRNLKNASNYPGFMYLPSVETPVNVLHALTRHGYLLAGYDEESPPTLDSPAILTVPLKEPEPEEPRQAFLQAHDEDMVRVSQGAINQYGQVVAMYTGRHASFVPSRRRKRETEEVEGPTPDIVMSDTERKIIVVTSSPIIFRKGENITRLTQVTYASKEAKKKPYIALDVKFKEEEISLDLIFNSPTDKHAWTLEAIKIEHEEVELRSRRSIGAPAGYSYFCAQYISFRGVDQDGVKYSLTFHSLQVQPRVVNNEFGPVSDCVGYFTEPILSGLIILFLLFIVATMAILCIQDIRAMDKFDDAKGKIISFTLVE